MKLHASAIEKLISLFHVHGGTPDEVRLKRMIQELDFTPYERKTTEDQEIILVLTEEYVKALNVRR